MPAHDTADFASKLELEDVDRKRFLSGEARCLVAGPMTSSSCVQRKNYWRDSTLTAEPRRRH